jgi:hypothetical protein
LVNDYNVFNDVPHGGMGCNVESWMNDIPPITNIINSSLRDLNPSHGCYFQQFKTMQKFENSINIIDLFDFP